MIEFARPFALWRKVDVTGISGCGAVAWGAVFPDGTTVLRWCSEHAGSTEIVWQS